MTRWRRWLIALAAGIAVVVVILLALGQYLSVYAHRQLIEALRERYQSDVAVRSIRVSLLPPFGATLEELEFRHQGRRDVPPLIAIRRASASVGIAGLFQSPKRVREVTLEGLQIHVPPRGEDEAGRPPRRRRQPRSPFVIASIVADGDHASRAAREVRQAAPGVRYPPPAPALRGHRPPDGVRRRTAQCQATRHHSQPRPVRTVGRGRPGRYARSPATTRFRTPISPSSAASPAFSRHKAATAASWSASRCRAPRTRPTSGASAATPLHLKTEFSATVDGTDGDTYLHPVTAHFLRSTVVANGSVAGTPGVKGKTVALDATVEQRTHRGHAPARRQIR